MVYTVAHIKQGTGFAKGTKFLDAADSRMLRAALKELLDATESCTGHNRTIARSFAKGALKKTEGIEP